MTAEILRRTSITGDSCSPGQAASHLFERQPDAERHETKLRDIWVSVFEDATTVAVVPNVKAHPCTLCREDIDAASDVVAAGLHIFPAKHCVVSEQNRVAASYERRGCAPDLLGKVMVGKVGGAYPM